MNGKGRGGKPEEVRGVIRGLVEQSVVVEDVQSTRLTAASVCMLPSALDFWGTFTPSRG